MARKNNGINIPSKSELEKERMLGVKKSLINKLRRIKKDDKESFDKFVDEFDEIRRSEGLKNEGGYVTPDEWRLTHPFAISCASDKFYSDLANELLDKFLIFVLPKNMPAGILRNSALSIAAYLEDLVTETGIWDAVRSMYSRQYGRKLPFYEIDEKEYYDDDLNIEDLQILVWTAFCRVGAPSDIIYSPVSQGVTMMAKTAYELLIDRIEEAPAATRVKDKIQKVLREGDLYMLRSLGVWLSIDYPLTAAPYARDYMVKDAEEALVDLSDKEYDISFEETLYYEEAKAGWTDRMSLNGCPVQDLLSVIAVNYGCPGVAEGFKTFKILKNVIFTVENSKGAFMTLKDEIGQTFKVKKNSFGRGVDWDTIKSGLATFVRYGDVYYQNGLASLSEELPKKLDKVLTQNLTEQMFEIVNKAVRENDGRRVFYCRDVKEVSKILDGAFAEDEPEKIGSKIKAKNILLLLSSTDGPILKPDDCDIFNDKENPFYKKKKNIGDYQLSFICNSYLPDDAIDYIVDNNLLPDACMHASQGEEVGKSLVQDNMRFLFQFARVDSFAKSDDED